MNQEFKEKFWAFVGVLIILIGISSFTYYTFFYKPQPRKFMTAQEQRELEEKLIERYGSLEAAEDTYREQNEYGEGWGPGFGGISPR